MQTALRSLMDLLRKFIQSLAIRERNLLNQRFSIEIQRGNAACIQCCFSDGCFDADVLVQCLLMCF